ncbi:Zinc finger protein [Plakobranchus ocellatus]|uniref:Zinc finger protein n=1 Tax=Plakobranchus ocellatus TaxID=259542 RepID=A0AAV3YS68_9GAST|nr:Zinc finger protein [Plakobranchus ocellatus]
MSPYHPQCNRLVEKCNVTLKSMLKKLAADRPKDWDHYISFAILRLSRGTSIILGHLSLSSSNRSASARCVESQHNISEDRATRPTLRKEAKARPFNDCDQTLILLPLKQ